MACHTRPGHVHGEGAGGMAELACWQGHFRRQVKAPIKPFSGRLLINRPRLATAEARSAHALAMRSFASGLRLRGWRLAARPEAMRSRLSDGMVEHIGETDCADARAHGGASCAEPHGYLSKPRSKHRALSAGVYFEHVL